jgi:putative hemolysin
MRIVYLAAAAFVLAGCQSVSNVVPAGNGAYMVGSEVRGGFSSWAEVRALTLNRASEYCANQGKEMEAVDSKTRGARGWTPQEAELTFRCVDGRKS